VASEVLNIGMVFGGVSPEHEVSVISCLQAAAALDKSRYNPIPVYIAKDGTWYTGEKLLNIESYKDLDALRKEAVRVILDPGKFGTLDLVEARPQGLFGGRARRYRIDVMFLGLHGGEGETGDCKVCVKRLTSPTPAAGSSDLPSGWTKFFPR